MPAIRGKTIRFIWNEGPTKGKTHEHVFHPDGTVTWSDAGAAKAAASAGAGAIPGPKEKPPYGATRVADKIYLVSYLAPSGYTLTVSAQLRRPAAGGLCVGCEGMVSGAGRR